MNGHTEVAQCLLEAKANIDVKESLGGRTALHWAAEKGHIGCVTALLGAGTNVNSGDDVSII